MSVRIYFPVRSVTHAFRLILLGSWVPIVFGVLSTGFSLTNTLKERGKDEVLLQVESLAEIQNDVTQKIQGILIALASLPSVRNLDRKASLPILSAVQHFFPELLNLTITDSKGIVVQSVLLPEGEDLSGRYHVRETLRSGGFVVGEYIISRATNEPALTFSRPLYDDFRNIVGTVNAVIPLKNYQKLFSALTFPPGYAFGLVDRRGRWIISLPQGSISLQEKPIPDHIYIKFQSPVEKGALESTEPDGISRIYAYRNLKLYPNDPPYLTVILGIPKDYVEGPARSHMVRTIVILLGILILSFLLAWFLSRTLFVTRFKSLISVTGRLGKGDLRARTGIPHDGTDIGLVAEALDRMAEALEKREEEKDVVFKELRNMLSEKETLLREVHHRVKNNLQIVLSLIRLQADQNQDPKEFSKLLETRINAMALIHEMLYQSTSVAAVNMGEFIPRFIGVFCNEMATFQEVRWEIATDSIYLPLDKAVPFSLALNELLSNAFKYGVPKAIKPEIRVFLKRTENGAELRVEDNGPGFPEDFDPTLSEGLGMQLLEGFARQMEGHLEWENNGGACFILRFTLG